MKQIVLALLVNNTPGVLSRISGLFARRGYNIDTITAGATSDSKYTRITVAVSGEDAVLEQIRKQIQKLEDVVKIIELQNNESVQRELVLVKVRADRDQKRDVIAIADIFRAKIVDVGTSSVVIELTGTLNKVDAFIKLLGDFEIIELVRTGLTGLARGATGIKDLINN